MATAMFIAGPVARNSATASTIIVNSAQLMKGT